MKDTNVVFISNKLFVILKKKPTKFSKIFGSGPIGLAVALSFRCNLAQRPFNLPYISKNQSVLNIIFFVSIFLTLVVIVWPFKSLPAADRGNKPSRQRVKYFRHPLYAAFLSIFNFGLAFTSTATSIFYGRFCYIRYGIT